MMVCTFTIYALTTPVPPMRAKMILRKQNYLKLLTTKAPSRTPIKVASYASVINANALAKPQTKRTVVKAQLFLNKQPMICFVPENGALPMFKKGLVQKMKKSG